MKYLLVTSGTVSGLGKGTAVSSIGVVLRSHGLRVSAVKIDPYLNIDAATMSPWEHGEAFVVEDGGEVDLDIGNYERFLDVNLTASHSLTSGKVFEQVLKRERTGHYLGKTVQMIPAVTDAIQDWIIDIARKPVDGSSEKSPDVCLIELGGTIGDMDISMFLEAMQQLMFKVGPENFCICHLGMVPTMGTMAEQKTKPCQQSVRMLREVGLKPDFLLCRSENALEEATLRKLAVLCQVPESNIVSLHDISNMYRVPLLLAEQGLGGCICRHFGLSCDAVMSPVLRLADSAARAQSERLGDWRVLADRIDTASDEVIIAIVGRFTGLHDTYTSVVKALKHAAMEVNLHLAIEWVDPIDLEPNTQVQDNRRYDAAWWRLKSAHGVVLPGVLGDKCVEGKVRAVKYCRTSATPFLGIAGGMQIAVIEFARSELGWEGANSTEFEETNPHPVIIFMPEASAAVTGSTLRSGSRATVIRDEDLSMALRLFGGKTTIYERHRHRYEVNPNIVPTLEAKGMRFVGQDESGSRMQILEIKSLPFFIGTQFHPEFKSRPGAATPPFLGLVLAAARRLEKRLQEDGGLLRPGSGLERYH